MSLTMFRDDAMSQAILQAEKFTTTGTQFTLLSLIQSTVGAVYKCSGGVYELLTPSTDYNFSSSTVITLQAGKAIGPDEHLVVVPTDDLDITFTGPENSIRTQTKKLVLHNNGATTFDALRLYSEDFLLPPTDLTEVLDNTGYYTIAITEADSYYDFLGNLISDAISVVGFVTDWSVLDAYAYNENHFCVAVINGQYIGPVICTGTAGDRLVFAAGTSIPLANGVTDTIEVYSTGTLTFALGTLGGPVPADNAFKPLLVVPTLTPAEPTQYLWLREIAKIPTITQDLPNMPFKLAGQEY